VADEFSIDPRNKYGDADWEGDDLATFIDALNRGVVVRADGVAGVVDLPRENVLDAIALAELKSRLAGYQ
jgi:hypothetical protein